MLQVWSPVGPRPVDQVAHQSQALGLYAWGSLAAYQSVYTPEVSGVGTQAADWGTYPPGGFAPVCPGSRAANLGAY